LLMLNPPPLIERVVNSLIVPSSLPSGAYTPGIVFLHGPWFQRIVASTKSSGLFEETSSETPAFILLGSTASSDHLPGPFTKRNMTVSICAYSDRISCSTAQSPTCGGDGGRGKGDVPRYKEIFVERIATIISATNGIAISLVAKPESNSSPPTISSPPMKVAVKCGNGIPSFVKRPIPWFA